MIDLVLATVGRTQEPARLLRSLDAQTFRDFRLIVVDQNGDGRLDPVLAEFAAAFPLLRVASEPGLSRARNVGLRNVDADVVGFPDDDCWYPSSLLEQVAEFFAVHPDLDGLSGRSIDESGTPSGGRWDRRGGRVTRFNTWTRAGAYTIFLRRAAIDRIGPFDETLGLGAGETPAAAEDLDYVLRSVRLGHAVYYDPGLQVFHPQTREGSADPLPEAGYAYGLGVGQVLRKNRLPRWFVAYYVSRPLVASVLSLLQWERARARFYWAVARGRARGWRSASTSS
jgi:glycosyltransferase involved in cell wall biosynthesis